MTPQEKLWTVFSLYIRLRDTNPDGYGKCITCPRIIYFRDGDCGHGIGRQHKATKFHEKNNHLQCKPCNGFEGGKREQYKEAINKKYGPQTWDLLEIAARGVFKWSRFEFETMTAYYKAEINKLMLAKNFELK